MVQPIRALASVAFVFLVMGCGPSGSESKNDTALQDEVKRIEQTQIALIEVENKSRIEKLEKLIARMRAAMDAKAAEEVAIALIVAEEGGSAAALDPPIEPKVRERAGNAQQLRDAEQAHEKAKSEFVERHPGILEQARVRLGRERAAEASKSLDEAVGGSSTGKK